ncbi:MAG: DUF3016 domain-containing protein [Alcanivoracaceae bacterium]|nr:DUF3016 domain-containing protein [Alcanivoracaceae bacterium]
MQIIKLFSLVLIFTINTALAEKPATTVNFNNPEKFTDFKTRIHSTVIDREKLMEQLQGLMIKSAANILSNDSSLQIVVNNIDMAGGFLYGGHHLFRVINDTDRIRLEFSYRLLDISGSVLKEDHVNLTTRNPRLLKRETKKYNHSYFSNEMLLFDNWLSGL